MEREATSGRTSEVNVLGIIFPLGCDTWRFQMAKAIQITQIDMREMHIRSHLICPISPSSRSSAFAFDVIWNAPCSRPFASSFIRLLYSFFIYLCLTLTWCTALEVWLYWLKWNFKMNSHKKRYLSQEQILSFNKGPLYFIFMKTHWRQCNSCIFIYLFCDIFFYPIIPLCHHDRAFTIKP